MEKQTISIHVDDMTMDQLSLLMQGFCHKANRLREEIKYLQAKIDERMAEQSGEKAQGPQ